MPSLTEPEGPWGGRVGRWAIILVESKRPARGRALMRYRSFVVYSSATYFVWTTTEPPPIA
jgi:hypothetical protein